jgi:hypothetical protein
LAVIGPGVVTVADPRRVKRRTGAAGPCAGMCAGIMLVVLVLAAWHTDRRCKSVSRIPISAMTERQQGDVQACAWFCLIRQRGRPGSFKVEGSPAASQHPGALSHNVEEGFAGALAGSARTPSRLLVLFVSMAAQASALGTDRYALTLTGAADLPGKRGVTAW